MSGDSVLIKTGSGVAKDFLRKEVEDIKNMLDQLPTCQTKEQLQHALKYCGDRITALLKLTGGYWMRTEVLPRGNRVFARYSNGVVVTMQRLFGGSIDYWAYHAVCRAHAQAIGFWHTKKYDTSSGELLGRNFIKFREWLSTLRQLQISVLERAGSIDIENQTSGEAS